MALLPYHHSYEECIINSISIIMESDGKSDSLDDVTCGGGSRVTTMCQVSTTRIALSRLYAMVFLTPMSTCFFHAHGTGKQPLCLVVMMAAWLVEACCIHFVYSPSTVKVI